MTENKIDEPKIEDLKELLKSDDSNAIINLLEGIHPVDIAKAVSDLDSEEALLIIKLIDSEKTSDVLLEVDENQRDKILAGLTDFEIAEELTALDTDDAADIIANLPPERKQEVISAIDDKDHATGIVELLRYAEDSAGGLMAKELVSVNENWSISSSLKEIKEQSENIKKIHSIYVIDDEQKLKGRISIKDVLINLPNTEIKNICIPEVNYVYVHEKSEEIARIMSKYDLESIPVIDELGRLVGRITIDDIIDVMREEAEKDYQLAAGITGDIESSDSLFKGVRVRLPWLLIGGFGGLGAASVIDGFQNVLLLYPILIMFIPLIQSTAGNVGVQSSAIVVQSIANDTFDGNMLKRLLKELSIGLINGIIITSLVLIFAYFGFNIPIKICLTIALALITVVINSGMVGTFVPVFLNKKNIDPALATGPFITTSADILGVLIYFGIAKLLLHI